MQKNKKYSAGKETRPLRNESHLAKENSYPARCEKQESPRDKPHAFRWKRNKKTFEENGRRDLARNEKRDIYFEKRDISRNVWHFARNLAVDIEKVWQFQ